MQESKNENKTAEAFDPSKIWNTHLGYWELPEKEQARLADKRAKAQELLSDKTCLVLFSGQELHYSVGRFMPEPWFRDLTELKDPGCALLFDGVNWTLYAQESTRSSMVWEGYRLGSARSVQALGIQSKPISEFDADAKKAFESSLSLAMLASDDSGQAQAVRKLWADAANARARQPGPRSLVDAQSLLEPLRLVCDADEAERLRASCKIASLGHMSAWEALFRAVAKLPLADSQTARAILEGDFERMTPDWEVPGYLGPLAKAMLFSGIRAPLSERLLEGAFLAMCSACGADAQAYAPIVAAAENAVCLHWSENRRRISDVDWVLMDMGCSYAGFSSDLTRTIPANGSFKGVRGEVYRLLLDAQLAGIESAVEGERFDEPHRVCREILADGLEEMGLLLREWAPGADDAQWRQKALDQVFPHSSSHYIGRQVHDIGARFDESGKPAKLQAGMRITVEPGLYFLPDLPGLPEELKGFGARIEDVCLISTGGQPPEVLTALCPKDPEAIEAFAKTCGLLGGVREDEGQQ